MPDSPPSKIKLAVLLREDLPTWQKLNVTAFVVSGLAATQPQIIGAPYRDADGTDYLPMFAHPVLVYAADADVVKAAHGRALGRGLPLSVFTSDLFATGNDIDNRAAVAAVRRDDLDLVGLAMLGGSSAVDKVLKGARLHA